ncbi:beta-1,3-galactosyltransferase 5-like [Symsagittifera roscoffensis]|uniref:beta-1,3-galactosyltransferase 5-like n=1 Tax=Symsagittifera roscoffensis TaxID=84072 RepID=UPI00307BFF60
MTTLLRFPRRFKLFYIVLIFHFICFSCLLVHILSPEALVSEVSSPNRYNFDVKWAESEIQVRANDSSTSHLFHIGANDTPSAYMKGDLILFSAADVCERRGRGFSAKSGEDMVLVLIASRPDRVDLRQTIRNTWAKKESYDNLTMNFVLLFAVNLPDDSSGSRRLESEAKYSRDIIVVNLKPEYHLLTVQLLMALQWVNQSCPDAKYVLKVDDDTYTHLGAMDKFIRLMELQKPTNASGLYGGNCFKNATVLRKGDKIPRTYKKWVVSHEQYSEKIFPRYCNGPAYFFSTSLLPQITAKCPFHCTGFPESQNFLNSSQNPGNRSGCFWDWEDVFFGSCISTFEKQPYTNFEGQNYYLAGMPKVKDLDPSKPYEAIHPIKRPRALNAIYKKYSVVLVNEQKTKLSEGANKSSLFSSMLTF